MAWFSPKPEPFPPATLNEIAALLRETNLLLREGLRAAGLSVNVPRISGPVARKPLDYTAVTTSGRRQALELERLEQEREVAPQRFGPDNEKIVPGAGPWSDTESGLFPSVAPATSGMPAKASPSLRNESKAGF